MYEAVWDGSEDPRIAEGSQALESLQSEFAEYRQQMDERERSFNEYVDRESTRYFNYVAAKHPDLIEALEKTEGADEIVLGLSEGLDFEDALIIWGRGPEAVAFAQKAVTDGVGEEYIKDLVDVKFPVGEAPPEAQPKTQPDSADLVTGAEPARRGVVPEPQEEAPRSANHRRLLAAQRALKMAQKR
jgi:hypothetical protein